MDRTLTRSEIYCLVPRELAAALVEPLRDALEPEGVQVIVERRDPQARVPYSVQRKRSLHVPRALGELPPEAAPHAAQLRIVQRLAAAGLELADAPLSEIIDLTRAGDGPAASELVWRINARVAAALGQRRTQEAVEAALGRVLDALPGFYGDDEMSFLFWVDAVVTEQPR